MSCLVEKGHKAEPSAPAHHPSVVLVRRAGKIGLALDESSPGCMLDPCRDHRPASRSREAAKAGPYGRFFQASRAIAVGTTLEEPSPLEAGLVELKGVEPSTSRVRF